METELVPLGSLLTPFIIFLCALSLRAIFSFLETSITALRLFKLKEIATNTQDYKTLLTTLEQNPHRVLITIIIASSLADVTSAALATNIMEQLLPHIGLSGTWGLFIGIAIATFAILLFGEIIPKNAAKGHGEQIFKATLWITNIVFHTFYHFVTILLAISDFFVTRISGKPSHDGSTEWVSSEKEIQFLIDYINEKGLMETEKTAMLQSIFDLGRTPVKEVLVPAVDIISVEVSTDYKDIIETFLTHGFTRLPVYENSIDNIIGMIHLKDVFALTARNETKSIKEIMRPILFVPETVKINQLLREFRQQHMHIAIVLNEHGSITGLITLEDVLEEIVGDISDEHELAAEKIIPLKQGGWFVDASCTLEELEEVLQIQFETEDSLTLGGFMTEQLQHLPKKGERFPYENFYFQVQKATPKRVVQVLIFHANITDSEKEESE